MAFRYPALQQQFKPRDGTSRVDCAATAGAILGDADSKGALVYNHSQVRQNTDEYPPDWAGSPGLNWQQVDASLFRLSGGRINLDVHSGGSPWSGVTTGVRAGKWAGIAVWRGVLVDAGYGGGNTFREAHAETYAYDQDRKVYVMGDPLVPRWIDVPSSVMERAAREFLRRAGYGAGATGAYYALTRDVYDVPGPSLRYSALFTPGAFWAYEVSGGEIVGRVAKSFTQKTSAPCDAPVLYPWDGHGSRKLVRVTAGALIGRFVEPGTAHVVLKVTK